MQLYNAYWELDNVESRFNLDVYPVNESFPNGTEILVEYLVPEIAKTITKGSSLIKIQ